MVMFWRNAILDSYLKLFDLDSRLPGVFRPNGAITAVNSSQISDGAAAVLLASGQKAGSVARTVEISNRAGLAVRVNYSAPQPERLVDEQDQANHIPFGRPPHLAFPDHVHRCVALNC